MTAARPRAKATGATWLAKTLAGLILGLALGLAASGYVALLGTAIEPPVRAQLAMWAVMPVAMGVLGLAYLFRSGARAWGLLGAATVLAAAPLALLRFVAA